jgi:hypothetical protein
MGSLFASFFPEEGPADSLFAIHSETAFRSPFLQNSMRGNSSSMLRAAGGMKGTYRGVGECRALEVARSKLEDIDFSLFLDQRAIKNRPRVKACLIGPPEAPSVFILFFDWQANQ